MIIKDYIIYIWNFIFVIFLVNLIRFLKKYINIIVVNCIFNVKYEFEMVKCLKGEVGKYDF